MRAAPSGAVFLIAVELFESKAVSLLFASIFGNLSRSYLFGAVNGWGKIQSVARQQGINIGTFSLLRDIDITDRKAVVELPNLKALEESLKMLGPAALRDFKNKSRRIGHPARNALRSVFLSVGIHGPLGAPRRKGRTYDKMSTSYQYGRLSYIRSRSIANTKGVDVNYKNRREGKALRDMKAAKDGTISIVRLIVRAPAFIVADMANKTGTAKVSSGELVRKYDTRLFGRNVVSANENMRRMTPARRAAVDNWLLALDRNAHNRRQNKPSRYAWPTMEKYMSKHKVNASQVMNETIAEINKRLAK